jgi:hypothetical protein
VKSTGMKVIATMAIAGAMILGSSTGASASESKAFDGGSASKAASMQSPVNSAEVAEVRKSLSALGIDSATQQKLIFKLFVLGQRLDGDTDAAPVSEETWTDAKGIHTRYTYADGSRSETVMETPPSASGPSTMASGPSASGCTLTSSGDVRKYSSCRVNMSRPTYQFSFILTYEYRQFGCHIYTIGSVTSGGAGIQSGSEKVSWIQQSSQQHAGICHATATVVQKLSVGGVGFNSTVGIDVRVQASSSWTNKLSLTRIDD